MSEIVKIHCGYREQSLMQLFERFGVFYQQVFSGLNCLMCAGSVSVCFGNIIWKMGLSLYD
jgi:hypothetical protein